MDALAENDVIPSTYVLVIVKPTDDALDTVDIAVSSSILKQDIPKILEEVNRKIKEDSHG